MGKLISIWNFICRRKYLITIVAFAVIIGFLDENSLVRRLGYEREISQLKEEIEKYRTDYEENTKRLNEISTNPDAIEQIAREKYLMKKPNEAIPLPCLNPWEHSTLATHENAVITSQAINSKRKL